MMNRKLKFLWEGLWEGPFMFKRMSTYVRNSTDSFVKVNDAYQYYGAVIVLSRLLDILKII